MAIERQKTFIANLNEEIDLTINKYLLENEVDPAAIQLIVDAGRGKKIATLTYGDRGLIEKAYEAQNRQYTNADKTDYCRVKDIIVPFSQDLDDIVNTFIANENIAVISISRYISAINQGALIFFVDVQAQKAKIEEKQKEVEKLKKEMADKLAREAVKDVELNEQNEIVEKYNDALNDAPTATAGLSQIVDEIKNPEGETTTMSTNTEPVTITMSEEKEKKNKGIFGKRK